MTFKNVMDDESVSHPYSAQSAWEDDPMANEAKLRPRVSREENAP